MAETGQEERPTWGDHTETAVGPEPLRQARQQRLGQLGGQEQGSNKGCSLWSSSQNPAPQPADQQALGKTDLESGSSTLAQHSGLQGGGLLPGWAPWAPEGEGREHLPHHLLPPPQAQANNPQTPAQRAAGEGQGGTGRPSLRPVPSPSRGTAPGSCREGSSPQEVTAPVSRILIPESPSHHEA